MTKGKIKVGKINFSKGQDRAVWFNLKTKMFEVRKYWDADGESTTYLFGSWSEVTKWVNVGGWVIV